MTNRVVIVKSYIPDWIAEEEPIKSVLESIGQDTGQVENSVKDVLSQCFIDTATWGIKYWEEYLGIPVNESKPLSFRQSVVKSKLRGAGTTTASLVEATTESYQNGDVEVIEVSRENKVQIKFNGIYGIPPNMTDFQAAIVRIIPTHLLVEYIYTYLTWGELNEAGYTWADLDDAKFTWEELETWNTNTDPIVKYSVGCTFCEP
ncbi:putative phage tail protein [Dehalobacter sp. TBBPA1]|uniref:putative phage tail protein n=1 Tax=Dehalobacter sp. TBBPA1 TaxID=3235037 RepID=UPI0034A387A0